MDKIFWIVMAVIAGAFLPMQGSMNSRLAKAGENPVYASMISFTIGVLALVTYILLTSQNVSWKGLKDAPSYSWLGGVLGAFYVTVIIFAFPKIGPGLTFGLVVAGQLITSMVMEHFQIIGTPHQPISLGRIVGILLIIAGVVAVKKF
ncbi:DMT family transporter [Cloacibacterium sp.]|uniref:DMT family transporter n=1 Tax=Cloacibacterium sp. TaxID=1913682 RepID=UPI0039E30606